MGHSSMPCCCATHGDAGIEDSLQIRGSRFPTVITTKYRLCLFYRGTKCLGIGKRAQDGLRQVGRPIRHRYTLPQIRREKFGRITRADHIRSRSDRLEYFVPETAARDQRRDIDLASSDLQREIRDCASNLHAVVYASGQCRDRISSRDDELRGRLDL